MEIFTETTNQYPIIHIHRTTTRFLYLKPLFENKSKNSKIIRRMEMSWTKIENVLNDKSKMM